METFLVVTAILLSLVSVIPYIVSLVRGKVKPRIVSWFTWSLLTGIACVATFMEGQMATGWLLLAGTLSTLSIVILGFRYGDRRFERFDIICQASAIVGLILWFLFNSPVIAVIAAVTIDTIGSLPTLKHAWQKPYEEAWITYALSGLSGFVTLMALDGWTIIGSAYPVYIFLMASTIAATIVFSPHRKRAGMPRELKEL